MTEGMRSVSSNLAELASTMDGHEGDDERTSEHSGTELAEKDEKEEQQQQKSPSESKTSNEGFDTSGLKPMPIQKKHRRGSRRNRRKKYKPYTKMTWDEKKARLELDTKKATKMREQYMQEKGRPAAPYNTTQFLMDEHDLEEPDLGAHAHMQSDGEEEGEDTSTGRPRLQSQSIDDSDIEDYNESPEDEIYEQQFFEKDFTEAYEQVHAESLYSMNKDALVRECMCLEERVETLERRVREKNGPPNGLTRQTSLEELAFKLNSETNSNSSTDSSTKANEELLMSLQSELNNLRSENERLKLENGTLVISIKSIPMEESGQ